MWGNESSKILLAMLALSLTLWCLKHSFLFQKTAQICAGRWVRILDFRRQLFCVFNALWQNISLSQTDLSSDVAGEFLLVMLLSPLAVTNIPHLRSKAVSWIFVKSFGCMVSSYDGQPI